jgi:hypothetical protein
MVQGRTVLVADARVRGKSGTRGKATESFQGRGWPASNSRARDSSEIPNLEGPGPILRPFFVMPGISGQTSGAALLPPPTCAKVSYQRLSS